MASDPKVFVTPEQYLAMERKAERKSEYWEGQMFAMAGATIQHNDIVANLISALRPRLRSRGCSTYGIDLRLHIPATGLYTYPDVMVICGDPQFLDDEFDTVLNPILIFEVLSNSTQDFDRGRKFQHYRSIASLQEYITVVQGELLIEQRVRQEQRSWLFQDTRDRKGSLLLASVPPVTLSIAEIYEGLELLTNET